MSKEYRIRKIESANGDRHYAERRGLWGRWVDCQLYIVAGETHHTSYPIGMTLVDAQRCIDYRIAQDNQKEVIIDYP